MVKRIVFYDRDEAIQYQVKMRQEGYVTKMIRSPGKYEIIMAGETPEWKIPREAPRNDSGEST